jgi:hypothetical protein
MDRQNNAGVVRQIPADVDQCNFQRIRAASLNLIINCSQAKLGLDLQAWIGGLLKGQPPTPGPKTLACGHAAP